LVDAFYRPRRGVCHPVGGGRDQVFMHRQIGKNLASLRNQAKAGLRYFVTRSGVQCRVVEVDAAAMDRLEAHDGVHNGGLAHAVSPHQSDKLSVII